MSSNTLLSMRIDTHQHFWQYNKREYTWMSDDMDRLRRNFLPADLEPLMREAGIQGTVVVQARQTIEETAWLLNLAEKHSFIQAVVGWIDLCSDAAIAQLEKFAVNPKFRAVRHVLHDEPDDYFMLRPEFLSGLSHLRRFGLTYDLLLFPRHLPVACQVVARFPEHTFVLDHIAKPTIRTKEIEPWARDLKMLATFPNVACKISGLVTEASWDSWRAEDFDSYLEVVLEAFGPNRLMVGSDWPVCTVAANYSQVIGIAERYAARFSMEEQHTIWEVNPNKFYSVRT
jgi:L-fuconolactonase